MLTSALSSLKQTARRSAPKQAEPKPAVRSRAVPRLDAADKTVFETIAASPQFTLDKLKKLAVC
jgi:hypothetical protein